MTTALMRNRHIDETQVTTQCLFDRAFLSLRVDPILILIGKIDLRLVLHYVDMS